MSGIPISQIAKVTPGVISATGALNYLNGLILTANTAAVAAGTVSAFTSLTAVAGAFTAASVEYQMAQIYFSGYENADQSPSTLYFAGFTPSASDATSSTLGAQMDSIAAASQLWTGVSSATELSLLDKRALATWVDAQNNRFWGIIWDTDASAITSTPSDAANFGAWLSAQDLSGITAVYNTAAVAALALAWMASLDFDATNGRQTLAFVRNSLVSSTVTNGDAATNLAANGYSFYGGYAGAIGSFVFMYPGQVSGEFLWADSYINQIWLNGQLQYDLVELFLSVGNIPFNTQGDTMIEAALSDTITQAKTFGAIRTGVSLSSTQTLEVNNAAGKSISGAIQTQGYYLLPGASTASPSDRAARKITEAKLWYTDGQSVQMIDLASTEIQ